MKVNLLNGYMFQIVDKTNDLSLSHVNMRSSVVDSLP